MSRQQLDIVQTQLCILKCLRTSRSWAMRKSQKAYLVSCKAVDPLQEVCVCQEDDPVLQLEGKIANSLQRADPDVIRAAPHQLRQRLRKLNNHPSVWLDESGDCGQPPSPAPPAPARLEDYASVWLDEVGSLKLLHEAARLLRRCIIEHGKNCLMQVCNVGPKFLLEMINTC